jgi:membrane fusion protein, heavy metal efflux system
MPKVASRLIAVWFAALLAAGLTMHRAGAHEGHDHGAPPPPVSATIAPRLDASSGVFELVGVLRAGRLVIHVDRFVTNEPVAEAEIEVETPAGSLKAAALGDGAFWIDAAWAAKAGKFDLIFTVSAGGEIDVLTGTLEIPEDAPAAAASQGGWLVGNAVAQGLRERVANRDPTLPAVGVAAFLAGLLISRRRRASSANALMAGAVALGVVLAAPDVRGQDAPVARTQQAGADLAQRFPDGALFVPKATQRILAVRTIMARSDRHRRSVSLPGRIIPDPNGIAYVQTAVAGRLAPPPGGFPRLGARVAAGDVLAFVEPTLNAADATTQQQQARELDQQIALVQRRLERLRPISNVVARSQIEDAELELKGLSERRSNLDRAPRQRESLRAPMDGVIAAASAVAGQIAEPNGVVFQIVIPGRFWVEGLSYEATPIAGDASALLADGRSLQLSYRGTGLAERNQALPVQFDVTGDSAGIRLGQLVTVLADTEETREGIAVPRTSVLRGPSGQSIVYEHTNAERFAPREVRVAPLDGERVLILAGVEPGKRIVTSGAELLNQVR